MESWNSVINTALLGTEKRSLKAEEVDPAFAEGIALIQEKTDNREDVFLQSAALVYNYRQCGFLPLQKESVTIAQAEAEEKTCASPLAHLVLMDILETGAGSLLYFWLEQCNRAGQIVQPDLIPLLLGASTKNKSLEPLVDACCGRRGAWLRQFNEEWKKGETATEEELWQTGTLAQRKAVLGNIRKQDPAKARELLQQTWPDEAAATKAELLEAMLGNAGDDDVPWLEDLLDEKSVKVKDAALQVLKSIPGSAVVQRYWNVLRQSVSLNTSKGLLGIGSKTTLDVKLAPADPAIFKTGIQQLSSEAKTADEDFILYQLAAAVPPRLWESHFEKERKDIVALFAKHEKGKALLPALAKAAAHFGDKEWMRAVIEVDGDNLHEDAFGLLPQKEAEAYAVLFLPDKTRAGKVIQNVHFFGEEWSPEFAKGVLCYMARSAYQFNRGYFNELAAVLPIAITKELEGCAPKEEYLRTAWNNVSEHITKLLALKQQTIKAFSNF